MRIMPVEEALRENFPSILGVEKPFMPRSRMKPRTFPSSHLAQTTAMSATGELVILTMEVSESQESGDLDLLQEMRESTMKRTDHWIRQIRIIYIKKTNS